MTLVLDEDESFSMQAYMTSPGYKSVVLRGVLTEQRADGVYAAPLIPALFYGANGSQLVGSWRQYIPAAGAQTILSRSGGLPALPPDEELFWRRVSGPQQVQPQPVVRGAAVSPIPAIAVVVGAGLLLWWLTKNG